jgi:predicted transposase/invertase (TIGR01784 family)
MIEDALQEGYAKGRDEGLAEGREEGRADAAKRMIASGMTKEQVAAILELSIKEIDIVLAS